MKGLWPPVQPCTRCGCVHVLEEPCPESDRIRWRPDDERVKAAA